MPNVNGLFTEVGAPASRSLSVDVTTAPHTTVATVNQKLGWLLALVLAAASISVLVLGRGSQRSVGGLARRVKDDLHPADAVVGVLLLLWWILSPSFWDDGWIARSQSNFQYSGGFSTYYTSLGANHLLGYWLDWLQHHLATHTELLVVLRVPSVLAIGATWVVCRYVLGRFPAARANGSAPLWAMANALLLTAFGWGLTLRPEPFVALLVAGVTACAVRFLERPSAAPLALATPLVALAITAHPVGLLSIAPALAIIRPTVRWARTAPGSGLAIAASCTALLLTLLAMGSDIPHRVSDVATVDEAGDAQVAWFDEIARYEALLDPQYGTPLRRGSVVLIVLIAVAYLLRSRRLRDPVLDLPGKALAIALLLLAISPTKLPWHFGAFVGIAAMAAGSETARLAWTKDRRTARSMIAFAALVFAIALSWWPRHYWAELDLSTLDWHVALGSQVHLGDVGASAAVVALWIAGLFVLVREGTSGLRRAVQRASWWIAPLFAAPLLLFTAGMFAADVAATPAWTLGKQNLSNLLGDIGCGIGDHLAMPWRESMRVIDPVVKGKVSRTGLPATPLPHLPRFALGPVGHRQQHTGWFRVPRSKFGFFVSPERAHVYAIQLEWGHDDGRGRIRSLSRQPNTAHLVSEVRPDVPQWRFLAAEELPEPEAKANVFRIVASKSAVATEPIAVTAPVTYGTRRLSERLRQSNTASLVVPNISLYLPCQKRPVLRNGTVEAPGHIVFSRNSWPIGLESSPFDGATDLYSTVRLPLIESTGDVSPLAVFELEMRIPNSQQTKPPTSVTGTGTQPRRGSTPGHLVPGRRAEPTLTIGSR